MIFQRKVHYGIDAPKIIWQCLASAFSLTVIFIFLLHYLHSISVIATCTCSMIACFFVLSILYPAIAIIRGSKIRKFYHCNYLLNIVNIKGNETILDVGCGRGLLLIAVAKKLTTGKAIGIDIWRWQDQSGNSLENTLGNVTREGVLEKVEIITADARQMPFDKDTFDIIVSSWTLHNIKSKQERLVALQEIKRVLKSNGTFAIIDIHYFFEYEQFCLENGFSDVIVIGPLYTFGTESYIVKAKKL